MAGLKVITSLDAGNKLRKAAVEAVTWNIQIATGPSAEIPTDIKSWSVVWRCGELAEAVLLPPCPQRMQGCSRQLQQARRFRDQDFHSAPDTPSAQLLTHGKCRPPDSPA